eukprot:754355-Hanusia_phi.AAC.2
MLVQSQQHTRIAEEEGKARQGCCCSSSDSRAGRARQAHQTAAGQRKAAGAREGARTGERRTRQGR